VILCLILLITRFDGVALLLVVDMVLSSGIIFTSVWSFILVLMIIDLVVVIYILWI
jgi:hypothetical protein